jgi:hypothetical protein
MYLIHESSIKHTNGIIEISVVVVNGKKDFKRYTYNLSSQKAAETFHLLYRKGNKCHGKALSILNKFKI